ncbi:hypothetical protein NH341_11665 [Tenacibaculum sp. XPcli2-G]|uniref:hypothetical protein n=1 Tax=Tenacibaculum sp. XPcli2-G TaxID=2954503 RepID=UPI002097B1FB|nr:hypothetical protein [Tenacibaculum sp. XPcli2-G]MCO7186084.1 hypothetical protein [Tenacibaculum sp. XPcli2-G]
MKNNLFITLIMMITVHVKAQEEKSPLDYLNNIPRNIYKKHYKVCNEKTNVLAFFDKKEKGVFRNLHDNYDVIVVPLSYEKTHLSKEEIIKRQFEFYSFLLNSFKEDKESKGIQKEFIKIDGRNALLIDNYTSKNEKYFGEIKVYHKWVYLLEQGNFNEKDVLYKVHFNAPEKKELEKYFLNFKKCFSINSKPILNVSKPLDKSYSEIFLNELESKLDLRIEKEINKQGKVYVNEKSYKATRTFNFRMNSIPFGPSGKGIHNDKKLEVTIARKGNEGILYVKYDDSDNYVYDSNTLFKGNILIRLENGKTIRCIDRNIKGYSDKQSTAIYHLSVKEIQQLKLYNISSINFTMIRSDYLEDVKRNFNAENPNDVTHFSVKALFR